MIVPNSFKRTATYGIALRAKFRDNCKLIWLTTSDMIVPNYFKGQNDICIKGNILSILWYSLLWFVPCPMSWGCNECLWQVFFLDLNPFIFCGVYSIIVETFGCVMGENLNYWLVGFVIHFKLISEYIKITWRYFKIINIYWADRLARLAHRLNSSGKIKFYFKRITKSMNLTL